MQEVRGFAAYLYRHSLMRYLFVGGTTFIIDFSLLFALHETLGLNIILSTTVAYWTSIIYNFCLNRWWTFSSGENKQLHKHIVPYMILLGCNYVFTVVFVSVLSHFIYFGTAKVLAVAIQTLWTYRIYKEIIFK